ncbi:MAG: hypothetical protein ABSC94_25010 [Polyangiaceae bacterium]|jgi:CheY-specific phosphatase CheX
MQTLAEQSHSFSELQETLVKSACELFGSHGLPVEHSPGAANAQIEETAFMAVVGVAAPAVRGSLLLLAARDVVAALQPAEVRRPAPTNSFLCDILGEYCNMLISRVKNRLATPEMTPLLSTPTTIFGEHLALPAPTSGMSAWHRFTSSSRSIYIRLDLSFELEFSLPTDDSAHSVSEGEMVMF